MAIHDGGVESSGRKSGRPGKLFGGNFRWELFGKCPAFAQGFGGQANDEASVTRVHRCPRQNSGNRGSRQLTQRTANGGDFVWRILIVRHQLPIQP